MYSNLLKAYEGNQNPSGWNGSLAEGGGVTRDESMARIKSFALITKDYPPHP